MTTRFDLFSDPAHFLVPDYTHFRVVGIHLPHEGEPPTRAERTMALAWYADRIAQARAHLADARRNYRFQMARNTEALLYRLEGERIVWEKSARYVLRDNAFQPRPYNNFATSRGYAR